MENIKYSKERYENISFNEVLSPKFVSKMILKPERLYAPQYLIFDQKM